MKGFRVRASLLAIVAAIGVIPPLSAAEIATYYLQLTPNLKTMHVRAIPSPHSAISSLRAYSSEAWDRLDLDSLHGLTVTGERLQVAPESRQLGYSVDIGGGFKGWLMGSLLTEVRTQITDLRDWFWVPDNWARDDTILVVFELPDGLSVSTPWELADGDGNHPHFRARPVLLERKSTVAIGKLHIERVPLSGGTLNIALAAKAPEDQQRYTTWIANAAETAVQLFGRLPAPWIQILVMPTWFGSEPAPLGEVRRGGGSALVLMVQNDVPPSALREDWTLYHEFSHLYHPYFGSEGRWLAEGLASYYQNVLRARAGIVSAQFAWQRLTEGFIRGAEETTRGKTVTNDRLMRTYWAGAVMALELDVRLRKQSHGSETLEGALRSFSECCIPTAAGWHPLDFMRKLDEITGADLFVSLYEEYSTERSFPNYAALLRELGIDPATGHAEYTNRLPLRHAIMSGSLEGLPSR